MPDSAHLHAALSRRAAAARRVSARSLRHRVGRLRARLFFITQIAGSAALAWYVARDLAGHTQPFFAPVAAVVTLGLSFGQRLERAVQIVFGVAIGVLIADVAVAFLGSGYWQLALIVFAAMSAATLLESSVLVTVQAGLQSAMVTILVAQPGQAFSRWLDAVLGGLVGLAAATITPASPLRRPRQHTAKIIREMSELLVEVAAALEAGDLDLAEAALHRARATETSLTTLDSLARDGLSVIRSSPFRRGHLPAVQEIANLLEPLDRSIRNLRVLIRRGTIALRQGETVPRSYIRMVRDLGEITADMATVLGRRENPEASRVALYQLAEETTYVTSRPTLSSEVIRAQVRSIVIDLLMVTGLDFDDALAGVPSSYSLTDEDSFDSLDDVSRDGDAPSGKPSSAPDRERRSA